MRISISTPAVAKFFVVCVAGFSTAFMGTSAQAESKDTFDLCQVASPCGPTSRTKLENVVVTATRVPTELEKTLATTAVITREDLSRTLSPDIAEVLQFQAGIDVIRAGGVGQPASIFIRGAESNHTLVLIDGVRMNPGTIGIPSLQNIPPEMIDHIEVVRGPRSTLYGTDAIGGVINIITRRIDDPGMRGAAQVGYGSYNTRQVSGLLGGAGNGFEADVNGSWIQSDGFPTKQNSTDDSSYRNASIGAHASTKLGPVDASARFFQSTGTSDYLSFFLTPVSQDFINRVTALKFASSPLTKWNTQLVMSRMDDLIQQNEPPTAVQKDYLRTQRYTADWQNTVAVSDNYRIVAGAIYQKENARSLSFGSLIDESTRITNFYVEDEWTVDRHVLVAALGYTDHSAFGGQVTWNLEYGFNFTPDTQLVASAGTAYRAPDATDRFGFGGDPNLNPEKSRNYELSLRQKFTAAQSASLSVFQNTIDDLINFNNATFTLQNLDSARIRGIEANYDLNGGAWRLHAQASYQEPIDRATDQLLLRRAKKSASVSYVHSFGPVELGGDVLMVGPRMDFGTPTSIELGSYVLANLSARYRLPADFSLLAQVQNVFNTQYEVIRGYNTADRGYFVAVKYETR